LVLLPAIVRYRGIAISKLFRGDAAFAGPKRLRWLEQEGFRYAIRIKANAVLGLGGHPSQRMRPRSG
jgi:hypothetical protein